LQPLSSREKILEVAEQRFAQRGYAGVGLRELAAAASLGKSSLFHHFESKAALYLAVLDRVLERIEAQIAPALIAGGTAALRLDRALDALIDALAEHPTAARLLLRALFEDDDLPETETPEARAVDSRLRALIGELGRFIEQGMASGEFREVAVGDALQTLIGATVYHFASGEFGEVVTGGSLFTRAAVARRKAEVKAFIHHGLESPQPQECPKESSQ